jgi:two-component system sensor histidine kinase QseC
MVKSVSIKRRLIWYVLLTTLVMSLVTGLGVYRGMMHEADEIFNAALLQTGRVLDGIMTHQSIEANRHHLERALERTIDIETSTDDVNERQAYEKKLFFIILDNNGAILLKSPSAPDLTWGALKAGFSRFEHDNHTWIGLTLKGSDEDLWIIVGERDDIREEVIEYIGSALLTPLLFIFPIILFFLWRTISLALRPLQNVVEAVRRQDLNHLKPVSVDHMPTEIDPLLAAINQMVGKLDSAYQREKRFVSDASHELRNPLAALLINVDNALEENSDSDVAESLESMKLSIARLSHLVSQLLFLSYSENPLVSQEFSPIDLSHLCGSIVEHHQATALARGQVINFNTTENNFQVDGVESLLASLVSNLLDNAMKYSPEKSTINVSCLYEGDDIVIRVEDSGEGLSSELQTQIVNRFVRAGNHKVAGAGLGLSIVRSIAEVHSATMALSHSELGGLAISIRFILSPTDS